jgi:hypothetical protein
VSSQAICIDVVRQFRHSVIAYASTGYPVSLLRFNDVAIRKIDETPKKSWDVVLGLPEMH